MLESNYARAVRMVEISLQYKPDIILLPEAFAAATMDDHWPSMARDATSEHLARFRRLSARAHCMIVLGYLEKVEGARRVRNAVAVPIAGNSSAGTTRQPVAGFRRPYRERRR